jgi:dATP pyrophosphohydrolase
MKIISNMIEAHIFRKRKNSIEFLLLKRGEDDSYPGFWQMVTGSMNKNEKSYLAALREIKEETGLKPKRFWVVPNVNSFYSHEKNCISLLPVFACEVVGNREIKISSEHCDYGWYTPAKAKKLLVWPGQRKSVDIITEYFTRRITSWNFVELRI